MVREESTNISPGAKKVCIVGASGKLGQYMVTHALDLGYEVVNEAQAIVGCQTPSALAYSAAA
jgi:hypothetical protein